MMEYTDSQIVGERPEGEAEFLPESVMAFFILVAAALCIVAKWPASVILIAGIPTLGGPLGIGLYMGLFWTIRWPLKQLFDHYRKRNHGTDS